MENKNKILVLWTVFLLGMIVHSLLAIMPVFWGQSIAMPEEMTARHAFESSMWMTLAFFLLPMIIIAATTFIESGWYKITNFILSILITLMNIFHVIGHLGESPVDIRQIVLLTFVLIFGILLNMVSFKWMRE